MNFTTISLLKNVLGQGSGYFSVKGHTVNILGFASHIDSHIFFCILIYNLLQM